MTRSVLAEPRDTMHVDRAGSVLLLCWNEMEFAPKKLRTSAQHVGTTLGRLAVKRVNRGDRGVSDDHACMAIDCHDIKACEYIYLAFSASSSLRTSGFVGPRKRSGSIDWHGVLQHVVLMRHLGVSQPARQNIQILNIR